MNAVRDQIAPHGTSRRAKRVVRKTMPESPIRQRFGLFLLACRPFAN